MSREPSQPNLPDISNKNYAVSSAPMNRKMGSNYDEEKLLLEQDAFLLEEQRYLDRLKNSELRHQQKFNKY